MESGISTRAPLRTPFLRRPRPGVRAGLPTATHDNCGIGSRQRIRKFAAQALSAYNPNIVSKTIRKWNRTQALAICLTLVSLSATGVADITPKPLPSSVPPATLPTLTIDYPFPGSVFPPDMVAPTLLWHDPAQEVTNWLIEVSFQSTPQRITAATNGHRPPPVLDPECATERNTLDPDPLLRGWKPDAQMWETMKRQSVDGELTVTVRGLSEQSAVVCSGSVSFSTSRDPVGAPLFYRDVPLMPSATRDGVIKPLRPDLFHLIKWRLRDVAEPESRVVMRNIPTCANCHSFSANGGRMAMDVDGPLGDKGAHSVTPTSPRMAVTKKEVFSWNDFERATNSPVSFGLFPRISPDGRYVAATVQENIYVENYMDFRFLQTFYPTRGIIAIYEKATGEIRRLPGADDLAFVQSNPVWSPDGREIVFIRAAARDTYNQGPRATHANDPNEPQIQYDLYRIPFNDGHGGVAQPVKGASHNDRSNSFPAFSPDGKWLVFTQCNNGLLMRPDGRLFIIPAKGGEARELQCNTRLMNSWHTWSPNSRWLAFSSKAMSPFTQIFLAHVDANGRSSPAVLLPNSTADNRAVNLPEFVNLPGDGIQEIAMPAVDYRRRLESAMQLVDAGRLDEAQTELEESLALKEDSAATHVIYGYISDRLGNPEEAISRYKRALAIDPAYGQTYAYWGDTLARHGKPEEAIPHFEKAAKINPDADSVQRRWGDALVLLGHFQEAVTRYKLALRINDGNAKAHHNLATVLVRLGKTEEAVEEYHRATALKPQYSSAYCNLGVALTGLARPMEAVAAFRKALNADPGNTTAMNHLAWLLATHPDPTIRDGNEAVRLAEAACRNIGFTHPKFTLTLAAAYAEVGRFEEAVAAAERVLKQANGIPKLMEQIRSDFVEPFSRRQPFRTGAPTP